MCGRLSFALRSKMKDAIVLLLFQQLALSFLAPIYRRLVSAPGLGGSCIDLLDDLVDERQRDSPGGNLFTTHGAKGSQR